MPDKAVIVGYIPLFYGTPDCRTPEEAEKLLSATSGHPKCLGVGWFGDSKSGKVTIVLAFDERSQEVFDHLMWYSESRPAAFFQATYRILGEDHYTIFFAPRPEAILDRFNITHMLFGGAEETIDEAQLFFSGIYVDCSNGDTLTKVLKVQPDLKQVDIHFVDARQIEKQTPQAIMGLLDTLPVCRDIPFGLAKEIDLPEEL